MGKAIFLLTAFLALLAGNALACSPGYYCEETYYYDQAGTQSGYYSFEVWPGSVSWEYYSPGGRKYSYYGPSYYGYGTYYSPYSYYGGSYNSYYRDYAYYRPYNYTPYRSYYARSPYFSWFPIRFW